MYPNDLMTGRQMIFTDYKEVTPDNVFDILTQGLLDHAGVRAEIIGLFEYEAGLQPIFYRKKEIRPDINFKVCINYAKQFTNFKLGYNYGAEYTCVQRGRNDYEQSDAEQDDVRIARMNEMFYEAKKTDADQSVFRDCIICGVGYMGVLPKRYAYTGVSPFDVLHLDPWNTFIIYTNDAYKRPLMAVTYNVRRDGVRIITAYTEDQIYEGDAFEVTYGEDEGRELKRWNTNGFTVYPNAFGRIPIIEFTYSQSRQGAWEPAISIMDTLALIQSDRANDISQYVQSLLWMNDVQLDETQKQGLSNGGLIITKSTADGREAKIAFVNAPLDQSSTQKYVDGLYDQMLEIVGVPGRDDTSGGSTGSAIILASGWQIAESTAKTSLLLADNSEEQVLDVALAIVANTPGIKDDVKSLRISDVRPYIGRNKTYELSSRVNSLAALINIGIAPETAMAVVDIFADPHQVALDSSPRINSLLGLNADGSAVMQSGMGVMDDPGEEVPEDQVSAELERLADNAWSNYGDNKDLLRGVAEV